MNAAHAHLLLNHLPVLGIAFSIPLLAFAWWRGDELLRRVALFAVLVAGLIALPAFFTGEPAEEAVERLPGVSESAIESHEEIAKFALGASLAAAVVAGGGLLVGRRKATVPKPMLPAALAVSCVSATLMAITANRGGEIRHPEITSGGAASVDQSVEHEDDD